MRIAEPLLRVSSNTIAESDEQTLKRLLESTPN